MWPAGSKRSLDSPTDGNASKRPRLEPSTQHAGSSHAIPNGLATVKSEDVSIDPTLPPSQQAQGGLTSGIRQSNDGVQPSHPYSSAVVESETGKIEIDEENDIPFVIDQAEIGLELDGLISPISSSVLKNDPVDMLADNLTVSSEEENGEAEHANAAGDENEDMGDDTSGKDNEDDDSVHRNQNNDSQTAVLVKKLKMKERKYLEKRYKTLRAYYNPRMWAGGVRKQGEWNGSRVTSGYTRHPWVSCRRTSVELGNKYDAQIGTMWVRFRRMLMLAHPKSRNLEECHGIPYTLESQDFLVAMHRLGRMMEPSKLSILLGSHFRPPQYCAFILKAFLGNINHYQVHHQFKSDGTIKRPKDEDRDIELYSDGSFNIYNDEEEEENRLLHIMHAGGFTPNVEKRTDTGVFLVESSPNNDPLFEKQDLSMSASITEIPALPITPTVTVVKTEDVTDDDNQIVANAVTLSNDMNTNLPDSERVDELQFADAECEELANAGSYQVRKFLKELSGVGIMNVNEYRQHCERAGITFDEKPKPAPEYSILRNHGESSNCVLAPDIDQSSVVKHSSLPLWEHASKHWHGRDLSRCALLHPRMIEIEVTHQSIVPRTLESVDGFIDELNPVCNIAPKGLLHLSDMAAEFILQIVALAVENNSRCRLKLGRLDEDVTSLIDSDVEEDCRKEASSLNGNNPSNSASNEAGGDETRDIILIDEHDISDAATTVLCKQNKSQLFYFQSCFDMGQQHKWKTLFNGPFTTVENYTLCERAPRRTINVAVDMVEESKQMLYNCLACCTNPSYKMLFFEYKSKSKIDWERQKQLHGARGGNTGEERSKNALDQKPLVTSKVENEVVKVEADGSTVKATTLTPVAAVAVKGEAMEIESTANEPIVPSSNNTATTPVPASSAQGDEVNTGQADATTGDEVSEGDQQLNEEQKAMVRHFFGGSKSNKATIELFENTSKGEATQRRIVHNVKNMSDLLDWVNLEPEEGHARRILCTRRMTWLIMHALGYNYLTKTYASDGNMKENGGYDDVEQMTYGEEVNYTNFGQLCPSGMKVEMHPSAIESLTSLVHAVVIDEAEMLHMCATNDSNRPWIDGSDVALVKTIRKSY